MEDLRELLAVGRVVELRNGNKFFVLPDRLIGQYKWINLERYSDNLRINRDKDNERDIMKVFNAPIQDGIAAWNFGCKGDYGLELVWEKNKLFS